MATLTISFDSLGGAQSAQLFTPDGPTAVVAVLPALGIRSGYYAAFAEALVDEGLACVVADLPGNGDSPVRAGRGDGQEQWSYKELVEVYAEGVARATRGRFRGVPFFWLGHSVGGQVALMHAGGAAAQVAGVALVAAGTPFVGAWRGAERVKVGLAAGLFRSVSAALGYLPGRRLGFGNRESAAWVRDWYRALRTGSFQFDEFDGDARMRGFAGPVFGFNVSDDRLAPEEATSILIDKTRASEVTRHRWEVQEPVGHNRWPRADPTGVAAHIAAWVGQQACVTESQVV